MSRLRRFGFGRNPLRRRVDRLESTVLLTALLVALLSIPVAMVLGTAVRDHQDALANEERAGLQQVTARTLEDTATLVPTAPGQIASEVRIAWVDATGVSHEGRADVLIGTRAGAELPIWLDRSGAIHRAPREPGDSTAIGVGAGTGLLMLVWVIAWGLFSLARRSLDHRRDQAWTAEWEQISSRWTRH
ncbi:hypothetical protein OHA70_34070 [Kribbella sp. NBC_00382]|uniref:Rv1733c family protein n=1 Tax=Kribbella sp. NBC_00382 TaxID=2975967 RepID=UPI002E250504